MAILRSSLWTNLKMYPEENSVKRSPTKKKKKGRAKLESKLTEVNGA